MCVFQSTGPLHDTQTVCLTCYKILPKENVSICDNCGLPFCCKSCQKDEIHKSQECALFTQRGIRFNFKHEVENHPIYQVNTYTRERKFKHPISKVLQ